MAARDGGGLAVRVRLTPKSGRDGVDGLKTLSDGSVVIAARVRAVPDKNAANRALEAVLAKHFALPKSAVGISSGHTARLKTVRLDGDPATLEAALADLPKL
ncbi:DUF167 family protein [Amorphus orientalis]|uniref:UPF0235 protein J2S73_003547 n=1 Tax=Amorphus orientalis TaxID=649198 RepID=A0AAE4AU80_9HYPH|nr:DUF167 family protein [Amorphus orientalis]MDQ0317070.1 uncharacterized protein YggU (UPF0235/DUF167 family) [Amorphus orientalis]